MIRRKPTDEHENHERWVISYADFITLLFAFFVVMYSISSVNEGKYKVLSESLVTVFNPKTTKENSPGVIGQALSQSAERMIVLPMPGRFPAQDDYKYAVEGLFDDTKDPAVADANDQGDVDHLSKLAEEMALALQGVIGDDQIKISSTTQWIEVDIKSRLLFASGEAKVAESAKNVLKKIAQVLLKNKHPLKIEGHTDNQPINTWAFPSNWELAAARATAVVRVLLNAGIAAERLAAVGYGEYQPVDTNDTEAGRANNRRVAIVISRYTKKEKESRQNYKLGEGVADNNATLASDPASRRQITQAKTKNVALKIIRLERGGLLFTRNPDVDKTKPSQKDSQ